MKTLDEVIKALEICTNGKGCESGCPYAIYDEDGFEDHLECESMETDALHYLKTIETTENLYHDAVNELSKWIDQDWKDRCLPLTWDELKQMEGKPVWVEEENQPSQWCLIVEVETDEDDDPEFVSMTVFDCQGDYWFYKNNMGTKWQAYRKERV